MTCFWSSAIHLFPLNKYDSPPRETHYELVRWIVFGKCSVLEKRCPSGSRHARRISIQLSFEGGGNLTSLLLELHCEFCRRLLQNVQCFNLILYETINKCIFLDKNGSVASVLARDFNKKMEKLYNAMVIPEILNSCRNIYYNYSNF